MIINYEFFDFKSDNTVFDINKVVNKYLPLIVCFVLTGVMLIPIIRVGLHNYASADDYWYGIYTYQGFKSGGILAALKGSMKMVKEMYFSWQGTWFTMFLFTLSPQNFSPYLYVITVFISVSGLFLAEYTILKRYLVTEYHFSINSFVIVLFLIFNISLQYIPRTTSGIFWFNGVMHYTIPMILAMGVISNTRKILSLDSEKDNSFFSQHSLLSVCNVCFRWKQLFSSDNRIVWSMLRNCKFFYESLQL